MPVPSSPFWKDSHESLNGGGRVNVRAVDDGAPLADATEQARPDQDGQMGGERFVRRTDGIGDHAGGDADRLVLDEQPEDRQARGLSERRKSGNRMGLGDAFQGQPPTRGPAYPDRELETFQQTRLVEKQLMVRALGWE